MGRQGLMVFFYFYKSAVQLDSSEWICFVRLSHDVILEITKGLVAVQY